MRVSVNYVVWCFKYGMIIDFFFSFPNAMISFITAPFSFLFPFCISFCDFSGPTKVITLTTDNYDELVTNSSDIWLIDFYAPW